MFFVLSLSTEAPQGASRSTPGFSASNQRDGERCWCSHFYHKRGFCFSVIRARSRIAQASGRRITQ